MDMDDELDELFNQIEITGDTVAAEYAVSETEREQITLVVDEGTVVPVVEDEERESTIVFAEPYEDHAYMFSSPPIEVRASMSSPTNATSSSNENYPTPPPPSQPIVPVLPITLPPPPPTAPQQIDIGGVLSEKHRLLQASEFQYLSKKHSSNPNAKNIPGNLSKLAFQLTLSQEESIRYHETQQSKELEEGKALAKNIVEVYKDQHTALTKQLLQTEKDNHGKHKPTKGSTRLSTSSGNGHGGVVSEHNDIAMQLTKNASSKLAFREVIRKHLQRYIELKNELMVKAVSVMEYPWHMVDNSVNSACAPYLKKAAELQRVEETQEVRPTDQSGHSSSSHQIGACRAYVIGFFEVLCCIPASMCSKQGVMFYQHAGVAIGRHPFRYSFMVVLVCLQILLSEVYMENLTHDIMLQTINDFVALAAQVWELNWPSFEEYKANSKDILIEALQHVVFLSLNVNRICNTVCQSVGTHNFSLPVYSNDELFFTTVSHSVNLPSRYMEGAVVPTIVKEKRVITLIDLYDKYQIPTKYRPYAILTNALQENVATTISSSVDGVVSLPVFNQIRADDFYSAVRELSMLSLCHTPVEIITVLLSTVSRIMDTCRKMLTSSSANNNANTSVFVNVCADELIPILALVLHMSLIMGNEPRSQSVEQYSYIQDLQHMYNVIKIAEVFMPEHMTARQDAYVVTVASTAVYEMAVGASVV